jgi:hypothetical protein
LDRLCTNSHSLGLYRIFIIGAIEGQAKPPNCCWRKASPLIVSNLPPVSLRAAGAIPRRARLRSAR